MISDFLCVILQLLKSELNDIQPKVELVHDQATELMMNHGNECKKIVEIKLSELDQRFAPISQRIKTEKVLFIIQLVERLD